MLRSIELTPNSADCVSVLHLSDLHFPSLYTDPREQCKWLSHFEALLKTRPELERIDVIAVTGDLLDNAALFDTSHARTLEAAKAYLHSVCEVCHIKPETQLVVIPGNHDYKRKGLFLSAATRRQFDLALKDYSTSRYFTYGDGLGLLLACFDSNVVRNRGELAMGCVDRAQLGALEQDLKAVGTDKRIVRIALVHHHPLPVPTSENLTPRSRAERRIGRVVEGAPEFMIFRNAGTFLDKLLEMRFRAVLHGHLHHRGYLRVSRDVRGREQGIEVFSAASLGAPPEGQHNSFHLLQVQHDGVLRSLTYQFDGEGRSPDEPVVTPTLRYENLRPIWWDEGRTRVSPRLAARAAPAEPGAGGSEASSVTSAVCELHEKTWEVQLPRGDVTATDVFTGMRSRDQPVDSLPLFADPGSLTAHELYAFVPGAPGRVSAEAENIPGGGGLRCWLRFNPPLTADPITVVVVFRAEGMVMPSREEQALGGLVASDRGWESCTQIIGFPTHRLKMTLRFEPQDRTPESVYYTVLEPWSPGVPKPSRESGRKDALSETALTRGGFHDWRPESVPKEDKHHLLPRAQATCFVDAPLLGYQYRFWWPVPDHSDIPDRHGLLSVQNKLLEVPSNPQKLQCATDFLNACLEEARAQMRRRGHGINHEDPTLHACLFALRAAMPDGVLNGAANATLGGEPRTLQSIASTVVHCELHRRPVKWGADIIGQAFRRGSVITFARTQMSAAVKHVHDLPPEIQFLLACPLYCYRVDGNPAAVIALASTSLDSGLSSLLSKPRSTREHVGISEQVNAAATEPAGELTTAIFSLWSEFFPRMLDLEQPSDA